MNIENYNYHMDERTWGHTISKYRYFDTKRMCIVVTTSREDEDGGIVEEDHDLPVLFRPCNYCRGTGKVVNPAIDASGLTRYDFDEDPDFLEDYRNGVYDIPCGHCKGTRIVPEVDEMNLTSEQQKIYRIHLEDLEEERAYQRMCALERAMGA